MLCCVEKTITQYKNIKIRTLKSWFYVLSGIIILIINILHNAIYYAASFLRVISLKHHNNSRRQEIFKSYFIDEETKSQK